MGSRVVTLQANDSFLFYFFALILAFYCPLPWSWILFLISLVIYISLKVNLLIIIAGLIVGLFLQGTMIYTSESAGVGLEPDEIKKAIITLTDDSSRTSSGKTLIRGELLFVEEGRGLQCSAEGAVLVLADEDFPPLYWGELIEMPLSLIPLEDSGEFPYIAFSRDNHNTLGWKQEIFRLRKQLISRLNQRSQKLTSEVSSLFLALYRGDSTHLDPQIKEKFRMAGVPHLLALSGFHVAILVLIMTGLISRFVSMKIVSLLMLPVLFLYLFIIGGSPSLLRAVLLYGVATVHSFKLRRSGFPVLLYQTCLLQLILLPQQGISLSFQLSYLALWGIVTLGNRIKSILEPYVPSFLLLPLSASLGAHISTAPLIIFSFGELYPVGILSSLVISPLVVLFMWLSPGAFLFPLLDGVCQKLYNAIEHTVVYFSACPSLSFSSHLSIFLYLTLLFLVIVLLYGRGTRTQFKLRFANRDQSIAGTDGTGPEKEMEPEFPY